MSQGQESAWRMAVMRARIRGYYSLANALAEGGPSEDVDYGDYAIPLTILKSVAPKEKA